MKLKILALAFSLWIMSGITQSTEIGLVQVKGTVTCEVAQQDFKAAGKRYNQLIDMRSKTLDGSMQLVLDAEIQAVLKLATSVRWWINENCRKS